MAPVDDTQRGLGQECVTPNWSEAPRAQAQLKQGLVQGGVGRRLEELLCSWAGAVQLPMREKALDIHLSTLSLVASLCRSA